MPFEFVWSDTMYYKWTEYGRLRLNLISLVWDHRNESGCIWNWFVIWSVTGLVRKTVI